VNNVAERSWANISRRTSPPKQRKKHPQTMQLDAAKMVPKIGLVRTSLSSQTRLQGSVFR
jgi:hypothetical protein